MRFGIKIEIYRKWHFLYLSKNIFEAFCRTGRFFLEIFNSAFSAYIMKYNVQYADKLKSKEKRVIV